MYLNGYPSIWQWPTYFCFSGRPIQADAIVLLHPRGGGSCRYTYNCCSGAVKVLTQLPDSLHPLWKASYCKWKVILQKYLLKKENFVP